MTATESSIVASQSTYRLTKYCTKDLQAPHRKHSKMQLTSANSHRSAMKVKKTYTKIIYYHHEKKSISGLLFDMCFIFYAFVTHSNPHFLILSQFNGISPRTSNCQCLLHYFLSASRRNAKSVTGLISRCA